MTDDIRKAVFTRALWKCEYAGCTNPATEIAHRIADTQANRTMCRKLMETYGKHYTDAEVRKYVIDNPINLAASCRVHNDYFNCGNNPGAVAKILYEIGHNGTTRNNI